MSKTIKICDCTLRDGQQSLIATRMRIEDMLPILSKMDEIGFGAMEVWGGATFDSCLRFLKEDPWERLRKFRSVLKNTKLQMLLRGQNILGYKHYADDVVESFVRKSIENGIDINAFDGLELMTAIKKNNNIIAKKLIDEGIVINSREMKDNPLVSAIRFSNAFLVEELMKNYRNLIVTYSNEYVRNCSVLDIAERTKNEKIINIVKKYLV